MKLYIYKGLESEKILHPRDITHVIVQEDVTRIHPRMFEHCHELISVIMFDNVTRIGRYAFNSCLKLRFIKLSRALQYIGDYCFLQCCAMRSYSLPATIKKIGKNAFHRNDKLRILNIPPMLEFSCLPDLSLTAIMTVIARRILCTEEGVDDMEMHFKVNELIMNNQPEREHLFPTGNDVVPMNTPPKDVINIWLNYHMTDYPMHLICFDPSVTAEQLTVELEGYIRSVARPKMICFIEQLLFICCV